MVTPNTTTAYKPSPLSFGSPRSSPFRRPSIASSPPAALRPNPPASPSSKGPTPTQSPSKLNRFHTPGEDGDVFTSPNGSPSPASRFRDPQSSPTRGANTQDNRYSSMMGSKTREKPAINNEALSNLPPAQLREMREAFQALDRDNDGQVNREDIADALLNLGQDSSSIATKDYFPPETSQTINLPTYLNKIATLLAPLSSSQELLNAFSAFDEDDSGQIDLVELRDALLHTSPEGEESQLTEKEIEEVVYGFTGKRAFGGKSNKSAGLMGSRNRSEVFRYQDFVGNLTGGTKAQRDAVDPADV